MLIGRSASGNSNHLQTNTAYTVSVIYNPQLKLFASIERLFMLFDSHMHTKWSGDSEADPLDMIHSAQHAGLCGLTFTDHLDLDFPTLPHKFDLDLDSYIPAMRRLSHDYSDETFTILCGLELGLQTHLVRKHKQLLSEYAFDFVIGSIHQIDGKDPYYDEFFDDKTFHEAYRDYFDCTMENLRSFRDIDALGHIDYICRYGMRVAKSRTGRVDDGLLFYKDFSEIVDAILTWIIRHDIALEINTAPFRYGFHEPNPSSAILRRYHELGGELLTLGADAHAPEYIAFAFDRIPDLLKANGFCSYYVYRNRIPEELPIE